MTGKVWHGGYREGHMRGLQAGRRERGPAAKARKPTGIRVMSKYPDKEQSWSDYQVWRVDFTSGPAEYWVVGGFVTGHAIVTSSHGTVAEAMAARSGMGHGIGAG